MSETELRRRLLTDTAWYGVSSAMAKALALLSVPILARTLGPSEYGLADLATSTAALLTLVAMLSADIPATRLHALAGDRAAGLRALSSYVWLVGIASTMVAAALLPASSLLASGVWSDETATSLAVLAVVLVPISAVQAALAQTQRIRSRPRTFAVLASIDLGAQLGLAVVFVVLGLGPHGVIIGFIAGSVIGVAAAAVTSTDVLRARPDGATARSIALRGAPFLPYAIAFVFADWIVRATLANAVGVTAVASFGVAVRLASVLGLVAAAFSLAWGPIGLARSRGPHTSRLFARALVGYGMVAVAAALALAAVGPELTRLVAGPGYDTAALLLPGLALAAALAGTEYVLVVAAGVADRGGRVAIASTAGAAVQVAVAVVAIPTIGIAAVGPAAVLGRATGFGILLIGVRSDIALRAPLIALAGLVSVAAAFAIQLRMGGDPDPAWIRGLLAAAVAGAGVIIAAREMSPRRAAD